MHETVTDSADVTATLTCPFDSAPGPGHAQAVVEGLLWLRMPLPLAGLTHINVWALEDGHGWTLVDTGMRTADTTAHWQSAVAGALQRRPVVRVICTHMHPDHIGMAGWLTRHYDCRLWTTRLEYVSCRMLVADTGREAPQDGLRFYHAAGWDQDALEHYKAALAPLARRYTPCRTATVGSSTAKSSPSAAVSGVR